MFETVNTMGKRSGKRLSEGAIASLAIHGVMVVVIVALTTSDSKSTQKKETDYSKVTFKDMPEAPPTPPPPAPELPPPPPPPPPPPAAAKAPVVETPKVKKPKKAVAAKPDTAVVAPPSEPAPAEPVAGGVEGGVEGGKEGGVVGGKIGGVEGGVVGSTGAVPSSMVLPFGSGMERPRKISGRDPEYSREAMAAQVEGLMIVRCVIELDGELKDCKVIKSLPYMESAVLEALATHKYTPVMFQGKAQRVNYTFNIKLKAFQQ